MRNKGVALFLPLLGLVGWGLLSLAGTARNLIFTPAGLRILGASLQEIRASARYRVSNPGNQSLTLSNAAISVQRQGTQVAFIRDTGSQVLPARAEAMLELPFSISPLNLGSALATVIIDMVRKKQPVNLASLNSAIGPIRLKGQIDVNGARFPIDSEMTIEEWLA